MLILVCNAGSTSLKYKLFNMPSDDIIVEARIERVGSADGAAYAYKNNAAGISFTKTGLCVPGYTEGINMFLADLLSPGHGALKDIKDLSAVGFKTVTAKGYPGTHELTEDVLAGMEEYMSVAPVHTSSYLEAIRRFKAILPKTLMAGVFETGFHRTIPDEARIYGIPYEWRGKYGIERLGFHGASHAYIASQIATEAGEHYRLISCHLGGSSSICAIRDGRSQETSFGFSLQSGLPHSTRVGDLDAYTLVYLLNKGMSLAEITDGLYKRGGLYGISGVSGDMRDIERAAAEGSRRAQLAIDHFVHEAVKYIGAYYAVLGGMEHLVFTAGIGENSPLIRARICAALAHMGVSIDEEKNRLGERKISAKGAPVDVWVIPANEETGIARAIYENFG